MAQRRQVDVLRGTLDMIVLRTLSAEAAHGYAIGKAVQSVTDDALQLEEGSLYPSLYRMERKGWIESEWGRTDTNRRAKIYRITPAGREHLAEEEAAWGRFSMAVGKVLSQG